MTDFARINQPRVDKINDILAMIWKSADSQGVCLSDIRALLEGVKVGKAKAEGEVPVGPVPMLDGEGKIIKPRPIWRDPPHQDRIGRFVADVPRGHVEIYITHLVARLCEMAAHKEPTP